MTDFNLNTAHKVARLARLALTDDEAKKYAGQMQNILTFVEQLNELDTTSVAPLANVADLALSLRDDVVNDGDQQAAVLQNAPEALEGFFVVQKVVE